MKYLLIQNKGEIIPQDIILMGSSTKRGATDKIGQFGSGSKYALAWLLRNDCQPVIYAGKNEIPIEKRMTEHRGIPRDVIYVNGENTNITTELGMKWTAWMALRELISNAIDESDEVVETIYTHNIKDYTKDGITSIFIPIIDSIKEVMDKYEHYFAFERVPDWIGEKGMLYLKSEQSEINIYRKGIRCQDSWHMTLVDYNFNHIPITEDRLIEGGIGHFDTCAAELLETVDDVHVLKQVILSKYKDVFPNEVNSYWMEAYKELIDEGHTFTTKTMKDMLGMVTNGHVIEATHFKALIKAGLVSNPLEAIFQHLDFVFSRVAGPCEQVQQLLSRFGNFKVYFGKMDSYKDIKIKGNELYIKDTYVTKTPAYTAAKCLMEYPDGVTLISSLL